jgi:hypothetical protein
MFTKSKNNFFVISILLILCFELFVHPSLQFLKHGLGFDIISSYLLRFNYILVSFLGLLIIFLKMKIPNIFLIKIFLLFFVIAFLKGVFLGNYFNYSNSGSNIFISHIYYFINPILAISLGYYTYNMFFKNKYYFSLFSKLLKFSFVFGFVLAFVFQISYKLGFASYNSLDIWNVFYGGSYMLSTSSSFLMSFIVILKSLLLGKRVAILIALIFVVVYLFKNKLRKVLIYFIPLLFIIFALGSNEVINNIGGVSRLNATVESLNNNDIDGASAGRLVEANSALEIISSSNSNLLFGTGMGSFFYPWPEISSTYTSHYTHFTPISYMWIGGVFLTFFVYFFLIRLTISLFKIKKLKNLTQTSLFQFMLPAIIISSITGAVLMNNSILWMIIGMTYKLIEEEKLSRKLAIQ